MAITKIWNIPKSKKGNMSSSLRRSLEYIVNPEKTEGGLLVGSVNCLPDAEAAYIQMCETKRIFGKELGRQGYHIVLSCPIGEGDPQTMYEITEEFIHEFLGDRYEVLFAVHVDKGHLHSHIVYNSCNMIDGYKYQYKKGDWKYQLQPITNRLCEKYGWSIMPAEYSKEPQKMSRREYEYQKSMKDVILADVEYCMSKSENMDEFLWNLEQLGYEVKRGKHIAVRMDGMTRYRRLDTLDESFSVERIEETLANISGSDALVKIQTTDDYKKMKPWKSDYQKNFYMKMVHLRKVEIYRFSEKAARHYRDIKRMHELQEQYLYLTKHNIQSAEQMMERRSMIQEQLDELGIVQKSIYADNRRLGKAMKKTEDTGIVTKAYLDNMDRLSEIKSDKKLLYQERKLADSIITEALFPSFVHIAFKEPENGKADIARPQIPESPWKKAKREKQEKIRQIEAAKREEQEKIKRKAERETREKKQSFYQWRNDCSNKFYEVVDLPYDNLFVTDYMDLLTKYLQIQEADYDIEFFKTPVISYEDYVRERKKQETVSEYESEIQNLETDEKVRQEIYEEQLKREESEQVQKEEEAYMVQLEAQNRKQEQFEQKVEDMAYVLNEMGYDKENILDALDYILAAILLDEHTSFHEFSEVFTSALIYMGVDVMKEKIYDKAESVFEAYNYSKDIPEEMENTDKKEQSTFVFPESYSEFLELPIRKQAELLCRTPDDADKVAELLQAYAESVGYRYSYMSDLFDAADAIAGEAKKMFVEKEAGVIVEELKKAGVNAENFRNVDMESMVSVFSYLSGDYQRLVEVYEEVKKQLDVKSNFDIDNDLLMRIENMAEKGISGENDRQYRFNK